MFLEQQLPTEDPLQVLPPYGIPQRPSFEIGTEEVGGFEVLVDVLEVFTIFVEELEGFAVDELVTFGLEAPRQDPKFL